MPIHARFRLWRFEIWRAYRRRTGVGDVNDDFAIRAIGLLPLLRTPRAGMSLFFSFWLHYHHFAWKILKAISDDRIFFLRSLPTQAARHFMKMPFISPWICYDHRAYAATMPNVAGWYTHEKFDKPAPRKLWRSDDICCFTTAPRHVTRPASAI